MGKVFVPTNTKKRNLVTLELEPVLDLTPAEQYGELETVLPHLPMNAITGAYLLRLVCDKIRSFTDDDYVLAVGDPAVIATVMMIAAERNEGRVNMLRWDRKDKKYYVIKLDLNERVENGSKSIFEETGCAVA